MSRALAFVLGCALIWIPSFAGDCTRDADCVVAAQKTTAGVCEAWGSASRCDQKSVPWIVDLAGDVHSFCRAYVNGCANASLTLSRNGTRARVTIKEPGAFEAKSCTLEVSLGRSTVESGTAGRIADSVEACVHNAPVYFYRTMKSAEEGSAFCCDYPF